MLAYYLVTDLELVVTAPRKLSSTPRGGGRGLTFYIMPSLFHFHGWTLEGEALLYFYLYLCNLRKRKARVLQTSLWILVDYYVDGVFPTLIVSVFMCSIS